MEFSIASLKDKEDILNYYNKLDEERKKLSSIRSCDSEIVNTWIENEYVNLYLLRINGLLVSLIKTNKGIGDESHSSCINISTRIDERNKGYAKKLIEYTCDELRKDKIKIIRVKTFSWNKPAIATVEKAGFTLSGRIVMSHFDEDLGDYIDDLLYHKFI